MLTTFSEPSSIEEPEEPWQEALSYWSEIAFTTAPARSLCQRLNIQLRKGVPGTFTSITPPIRRLVITGEDRISNFALLFGPAWEPAIFEEWKSIRVDVLNTARTKTKMDLMMDMGTPWYRPRAATAEELRGNETSEGGVKLEQSPTRPKINRLLSQKEDLSLEGWVEVLILGTFVI